MATDSYLSAMLVMHTVNHYPAIHKLCPVFKYTHAVPGLGLWFRGETLLSELLHLPAETRMP